MKHMEEDFLPLLNAFSERLKETNRIHAAHIVEQGTILTTFKEELNELNNAVSMEHKKALVDDEPALVARMEAYLSLCAELERSFKAYRYLFNQQINDNNLQLGMFSTMWGGYIEQLAVQYVTNLLRSEHQVHTLMPRFKRFWHKTRNVEVDLLAMSDTHAYILEVKNQLKEEAFKQMLTILDKLKEHMPMVTVLKLQPVFVCVHATDQMVNTATMSGIWVLRYKGFDAEKPEHSFEWLRKDAAQ